MVESLNPIIYVLIIGIFSGYFFGYFIKRLSHLALTIGVFAFLFLYLAYTNTVSLNLGELVATIKKFADILGPLGFTTLASSAPFAGSFVVGLVLGWRRN